MVMAVIVARVLVVMIVVVIRVVMVVAVIVVMAMILNSGRLFFLVLDHGTPSVQPKVEHPTCTVHCPEADFVAIAEGKENMITAYLRGDLVCVGNLAFALTFRHLIPVAA